MHNVIRFIRNQHIPKGKLQYWGGGECLRPPEVNSGPVSGAFGRALAAGGVRAEAGRCRFKDALRVPAPGGAGCSVTSRPRPTG